MSQIKSKERVRDLAEVYTNKREVDAMLDLIPMKNEDSIIQYKYLEPACGNGNFLIEILRRKLARVNAKYAKKNTREYEFYIVRALTTIYGIDICEENVKEAIDRLFIEVKSTFDLHKGSAIYTAGFFGCVEYILNKNIVIGDSINGPEDIKFIEYKIKGKSFLRSVFRFSDLTEESPKPLQIHPFKNFLEIGLEYQQLTGRQYEGHQRHFSFI